MPVISDCLSLGPSDGAFSVGYAAYFIYLFFPEEG